MDLTKITQADFEDLKTPNRPSRVEFVGLQGLRDLDLSAARALQRLKSEQGKIEKEIAALDNGLRADVKSQRIAAIKEKHADIIAEAVTKIADAKRIAEQQTCFWERNAFLLRARFADDATQDATIRACWLRRLEKFGRYELVETARLASAKADLPLASALVEELNSRDSLPRTARDEAFQLLSVIPCAADEAMDIFSRLYLYAAECLGVMGGDRRGIGAATIAAGLMAQKTRQIYDTSIDPEGEDADAFFLLP